MVIGASGFLGRKIFENLSEGHEIIGTYMMRKRDNLHYLDATDKKQVENFLLKYHPDRVIDTVGWANLFAAESKPEGVLAINYLTAKNIGEVCKKENIPVTFISSSYIFDGSRGNYSEKDTPNPKNQYGKTKIMAEKEILKLKNSIVIRTDMLYGYNGGNNDKNFLKALFEGGVVNIRNPSQVRSPTFIEDIAPAILKLWDKRKYGIFNIAGPEKMTKYDFFKNISNRINKDIKFILEEESPERSRIVPHDTSLDISQIKELGIKMHNLEESVKILRKQMEKGHSPNLD